MTILKVVLAILAAVVLVRIGRMAMLGSPFALPVPAPPPPGELRKVAPRLPVLRVLTPRCA